MRSTAAFLVAVLGLWMGGVESSFANPVHSRDLDIVLARTPDLEHGAKLYETCAACHGKQGEGASDGSIPALAAQPFTVIAKQLVDFRIGGRGDERMAHFATTRHLSYSQEVADVAGYISRLPARQPRLDEPSAAARRGATLYMRRCERCHGAVAEGNEDQFAPRLAGQHEAYIVREFLVLPAAARPSIREAHGSIVDQVSVEDIKAIAEYVAGL